MTRFRDGLVAALAVIVLAALAGAVVLTVLDAQDNGRDALADLQEAQVDQLADSMEARVVSAFSSLAGLAAEPWMLERGNDADEQALDRTVPADARAGAVLVGSDGVILNGVLLQGARVGDRLDRPGLEDALASNRPTLLPVARGVTTSLPTLAVVVPVRSSAGQQGAFIAEIDVSAESAFNSEVAELGRGETGTFVFVDERGVVLASSDPDLLGQPFDDETLLGGDDGFRRSDGDVAAVADVPSAQWRAIFRQDASEFEQGLGGRIQDAVVLTVLSAALVAAVAVVLLLRRLRAAREEQARLRKIAEAEEEFVSIVSHELRTPVAGVVGFLQTALDHWTRMPEDERRRTVSRALANARRLQSLTQDVLDTASIESRELLYEFDVVDLGEEVATAVAAAGDVHPDRPVRVHGAPDAVWVRGDPDRLQQVLANLLDNAVKNSPPGTAIDVAVADGATGDGDVTVTVTDQGAGFPVEAADRLFDKFVRGRGSRVRGTGLGLYICRQIVEAHGGRIWATSGNGTGTSFSFALPRAEPPTV